MKQYLLIAAILLVSNISFGQNKWSVGLRTGGEIIRTSTLNTDQKQLLLQEQIFVTRKISKRFELELNGTYKAPIRNSTLATPGQINDGPDYWIESNTQNILEFGLLGRYIVCEKNGWAPYLSAGINATNWVYKYEGYNSAFIGWGGSYPARYYDGKDSEFTLLSQLTFGVGVNKAIAKHWKLNAQVMCYYEIDGLVSQYNVLDGFLPKLQLGIVYCW